MVNEKKKLSVRDSTSCFSNRSIDRYLEEKGKEEKITRSIKEKVRKKDFFPIPLDTKPKFLSLVFRRRRRRNFPITVFPHIDVSNVYEMSAGSRN